MSSKFTVSFVRKRNGFLLNALVFFTVKQLTVSRFEHFFRLCCCMQVSVIAGSVRLVLTGV